MSVLKCKMCGGNIEITENQNIGVCDSCGSTMTIPNVNDERIMNLFDRANHFRLQNEFDKALAAYESILSEDNKNAEAHWGCVLSRYGIEYVKDPSTHKRVPTCHRVQNESVLSDFDYKQAVEYAEDNSVKAIYEKEAEAIAEIQKNILSIANNESPYDIFICYKETDNSGRRTIDSTLAQDIYYQLTNDGYKVFFSRITLEDKLGTEYEPYIFSALNSAKVMLVIGTDKDYFNAVWVKNEWARFLDLMKKDKSKMIIPCYRDMDAYDLPDELSMFQSQDMSKIGFVQDVIRGIKKVLQKEKPQPSVTVVNNTAEAFNSEVILKRAFMLLEDAEWQKADELLERILNQNPECAEAYLGKLMIDLKVNKRENLATLDKLFEDNNNYQKIMRYCDDALRDEMKSYANSIIENIKGKKYTNALEQMKQAKTSNDFLVAAGLFEEIKDYRDSSSLAKECREKNEYYQEKEKKNREYQKCKNIYEDAKDTKFYINQAINNLEVAIESLKNLNGWGNSTQLIELCKQEIEIKKQRIQEKKKKIKIAIISGALIIVCIAAIIILISGYKYNSAMQLYNEGKYSEAAEVFYSINYKDSKEKSFNIQKNKINNISVGDIISFGYYEQDNYFKEDIEWKVLAIKENKALIVSVKALDNKRYGSFFDGWENCDLRSWLNSSFLKTAFSAYHQKMIETSTVLSKYNITTVDKVFLLDDDEIEEYFPNKQDRQGNNYFPTCYPTEYAVRQHNRQGDRKWCTRDGYYIDPNPGPNDLELSQVDKSGFYYVRPAMWVNLNK